MSERSRSTFLLGCFGLAVLYLPDCARILADKESPVGVVHAAGAPLANARQFHEPLAVDPASLSDDAVAIVQEDYVGGE